VSLAAWRDPGSGWLLSAAILYVIGCFGVTMRYNVPRNNRLASIEAGSHDAVVYWQYVREWTRWNHVRTCASLAAAACAGAALATS
jgi:uncharacterized membrane protein